MNNTEIKFRAWVKCGFNGQKGMFSGFSFDNIQNGRDEANVFCSDGQVIEEPNWGEIIIMRLAGLIDDSEIYEGDVLNFGQKENYEVCFDNFAFYLFHTKLKDFDGLPIRWRLLRTVDLYITNLKIIGNVYENPELIK